jgi:hypothetical protein
MWVKIDDGFFRHPKARAAGKDGRALFIAGLCWTSAQLTDGFIAAHDLGPIAAEAEVRPGPTSRRLVEIGLWDETDGGWLVHDYHDFNLSAEQVLAKKEARSRAGRKGGLSSAASRAAATAQPNGQPKSRAKKQANA